MADYSNTSPYYATGQNNISLDFYTPRTITAEADDVSYEIDQIYAYRPDLLAYDLYGSPRLWWVFAQRNMNTIKDPVYDMVTGTQIYLPQGSKLTEVLGG